MLFHAHLNSEHTIKSLIVKISDPQSHLVFAQFFLSSKEVYNYFHEMTPETVLNELETVIKSNDLFSL